MTVILLADDNRHIREYCRSELEEEGYHVVVAPNGAEAVRLAGGQTPDVAVLDICMPGVDGLEAARRIHSIRPEVPVIFFTSFDETCMRDERSRFATACVEKSEDLTTVLGISGRRVRLGIEAPISTVVHRAEVLDRMDHTNLTGSHTTSAANSNCPCTTT